MEANTRQNLRDDQLSNSRSFGSNFYPSSQSRKISIGVMVESSANRTSRATKKQEVAIPNAEENFCNLENTDQRKKMDEGAAMVIKKKRAEAPHQVSSPRIYTRSVHQDILITERSNCTKKVSSSPACSGRKNKVYGGKDAPATHSVHLFANQTSVLESGYSKKEKFDRGKYQVKEGKDGTTERLEEFAFATTEKVVVSDKVVIQEADKTENRTTETLRMKLWEILGTVSSPNDQNSNCPNQEQGANNLKEDQNFAPKDNEAVKSRQILDTIETDSEYPDQTTRRPITRSLTQKRAPVKVKPEKIKSVSSFGYKLKPQQENIFTFEEGWPGRLHASAYGRLSTSTRKKSEKRSCKIEPRKIRFSEMDDAGETDRLVAKMPDEKTSSLGDKRVEFEDCSPENNREHPVPSKEIQEQDFHESPLTSTPELRQDFNSLPGADQQEAIGNSSLRNSVDPQDHLQSSAFRINPPLSSSSLSSISEKDQTVHGSFNPGVEERRFVVGDTCTIRKLQTSAEDCYGSMDDMEQPKESPTRKAAPKMRERDSEDDLSESSSDERDSERFEDGSTFVSAASSKRLTFSSDSGDSERLKSMLQTAKRRRTSKGHGQSSWIEENSEHSQEVGLERAVKLFVLALEKLKSKMKSVTIKKSSDIVMSVTEGICLQLQNVESQIQSDMGKMTNLGKSKRKQLETRFLEEQEQLRLIHEKFKEDVNRHFQYCRSTLEELEAEQIEFKGAMEKQKASYRDTLFQLEEAVTAQLSDAQSRISSIQELSRGKMLQLKHAIVLCLKDGIF